MLLGAMIMWVGAHAAVAAEREPRARGVVAEGIVIRNGNGQVVMQRVEARARWGDLRVAEAALLALRKIAAAPRTNAGSAALFSGADKAAKARAAEVLAADLHLALYRVDLSAIVSQYLGETEKNLAQVFAAAKPGDVVLFFDEADALFGKRTDVKDSHDRYANLEVGYLLQRLEQFQGLAILATNLPPPIDPAVVRRFRHIVEFVPVDGRAPR